MDSERLKEKAKEQLDGSSAANPGVVRTEASAAEEQLVPAMPEALPGEFVPCPRCNQVRARWETLETVKRRKGRTPAPNGELPVGNFQFDTFKLDTPSWA